MTSRAAELRLKQALHEGRPVCGTLVTSTAPKSLEAVEGLGLDCVLIDTEHIPLDWDTLGWMCRAYRGLGIVPIVRIPRADPFDVDAGGVVAAYVETAAEVRQLRGATKLRPLKGRQLDQLLAADRYPEGELGDYVRERNAAHLLLVNIESVAAIEALEKSSPFPISTPSSSARTTSRAASASPSNTIIRSSSKRSSASSVKPAPATLASAFTTCPASSKSSAGARLA